MSKYTQEEKEYIRDILLEDKVFKVGMFGSDIITNPKYTSVYGSPLYLLTLQITSENYLLSISTFMQAIKRLLSIEIVSDRIIDLCICPLNNTTYWLIYR